MSETQRRIEHWLHTIGSTATPQEDPNAEWRISIDFPVRGPTQLVVLQPKGAAAVIIAVGVTLDISFNRAFQRLDAGERKDLLHELRFTLLGPDVDFMLEGLVPGSDDLPTTIQVSATRYMEGLTLDGFAYALGCVHKRMLGAMWLLGHRLGGDQSASPESFDFKKLAS